MQILLRFQINHQRFGISLCNSVSSSVKLCGKKIGKVLKPETDSNFGTPYPIHVTRNPKLL
jgi:hypothetical protein